MTLYGSSWRLPFALAIIFTVGGCNNSRSVSTEKPKITFGISMSTFTSPYSSATVKEFKRFTQQRGYGLIILDAQNDIQREAFNIDNLMAKRVDAILVNPVDAKGSRASLHKASRRGFVVICFNSAVERPEDVGRWLRSYGPERICLAFDVRLDALAVPRLHTRGWKQKTALSLWDAVAEFTDDGLRHVLCTDIERDGALAGPNLALYIEALQRFPQIQWQASGGIASGSDLSALAALGVPAAISGKALLEERISFEELRLFLPNA